MSDNESNVTPIRSKLADALSATVKGKPYTGPSEAVRDVLKEHGFDGNVKGKGWVELRIVAQFSDEGCLFHTVQARGVTLTAVDRPAFVLLRMVAVAERLPQEHYVNKATIDEMEKLDKLLERANVDQIARIAVPGEGMDEVQGIDLEAVSEILIAVTERE